MKRVLAAMGLALVLGACGGGAVTSTSSGGDTPSKGETVLIATLREQSQFPQLQSVTLPQAQALISAVCGSFNEGADWTEVVGTVQDTWRVVSGAKVRLDPAAAGWVLGSVIGSNCPQHAPKVPGGARN